MSMPLPKSLLLLPNRPRQEQSCIRPCFLLLKTRIFTIFFFFSRFDAKSYESIIWEKQKKVKKRRTPLELNSSLGHTIDTVLNCSFHAFSSPFISTWHPSSMSRIAITMANLYNGPQGTRNFWWLNYKIINVYKKLEQNKPCLYI